MKLVQAGFLCLTMLAVADGVLPPPPPSGGLVAIVDGILPPPPPPPSVGFGAMSGIFSFLILLTFLTALIRPPPGCPANYIATPLDPNTCIRFFNTAADSKSFDAARTACQTDGGDLLHLDARNFDRIRQLADANRGAPVCDFWVGAREGTTDGVWSALNGDPIPASPFFNPNTNPVALGPNQCGQLAAVNGYYLNGDACATVQCYICQRNRI